MKMLPKSEATTGENTLCAGAGSIVVTHAASPTSRIWPRTQNPPLQVLVRKMFRDGRQGEMHNDDLHK